MYLAAFVAGLNLGGGGHEILTCASAYLVMIAGTRFLQVPMQFPITNVLLLFATTFFIAFLASTAVRYRRAWIAGRGIDDVGHEYAAGGGYAMEMASDSDSAPPTSMAHAARRYACACFTSGAPVPVVVMFPAYPRPPRATTRGIAYNWFVLACVFAADLVPGVGSSEGDTPEPAMIVAAFVLGRNADAHRGIMTLVSTVLVLAAAVLMAVVDAFALVPLLPLVLGSAMFFLAEHETFGRVEFVVSAAALAWALVLSVVVFVLASSPDGPVLAATLVALVVAVCCGLACLVLVHVGGDDGDG
jgi:hypothetical protein